MKDVNNEPNRVRKSAKGTAAFSIALAMTAVGVANAADLTVSAGSPKVLSAAESAIYYDQVIVNDDLTIDGVKVEYREQPFGPNLADWMRALVADKSGSSQVW